jgi:hypothetical protein
MPDQSDDLPAQEPRRELGTAIRETAMERAKRTLLESAKRLPYKLRTDEERAALKRLKPSWGRREHHKMFHQTVLGWLFMIDSERKIEEKWKDGVEPPPKNARVAESFQRRAKNVRNFVKHMRKPMSERLAAAVLWRTRSWPPPFGWASFPERELLSYAEACENAAAFFSGQPQQAGDPQNASIVKLLNFVRLHTGKAHLSDLATLLRRPCGDVAGMNAKRLDQLLRDHKARDPEVRREAARAEAGIAALLAAQILSKPPEL